MQDKELHKEPPQVMLFAKKCPRIITLWLATPANLFLVLALSFGTLFAFLIPPGYNPDEPHHFFRAYQISEGYIQAQEIPQDEYSFLVDRPAEKVGGPIPLAVAQLFAETLTYPIEGSALGGQERPDYIDWSSVWSLHEDDSRIWIGFSNTAVYSPIVYLPTLIAIWAGHLFSAPILLTFYLARLAGLIIGVGLTYLALRILPVGRWTMLVLALLPTTVNEFAAVSADPITISTAFLVVALTLHYAFQEEAMTRRKWTLLGLAMLALGLAKPAYAVLFGVALAIPIANAFARRRRDVVALAGTLLVAGLPAIAWQVATKWVPPSFETTEKVSAQITNILSAPSQNLRTLFLTFFTDQGQGRFFYQSFFGAFAWNGVFLPTVFIYLLCAALAVSTLLKAPGEYDLKRLPGHSHLWLRVGFMALFLVSIVALADGLYAVWSPLNSTVVTGLQGRYFIPFAFLLFFPFMGRIIPDSRSLKMMTASISTFALLAGVYTAVVFLYAPALPDTW